MVTEQQITEYVRKRFNEVAASDRIEDRGFAYYVDTQPRKYLDTKANIDMTLGNGPIVVIKDTGVVYAFSSSPIHEFGVDFAGVGVNTAKTAEEFNAALNDLLAKQDPSALNPTNIAD